MMNIVVAVALAAAGAVETIKLPPPEKDSGATVMQALKARHSERAYSEKEIPMETLSGVLWAANGFNRPDKRTNATGLNKQIIAIYAIMKSGAYRYDAKANTLVKVCDEDLRAAIADQQPFAAKAPVSLLIVADVSDPVGVSSGKKDGAYTLRCRHRLRQHLSLLCGERAGYGLSRLNGSRCAQEGAEARRQHRPSPQPPDRLACQRRQVIALPWLSRERRRLACFRGQTPRMA